MAHFLSVQQISILLALFFLLRYIYTKWASQTGEAHLPLPPGPKPKFLLGNITDLPPAGAQEWVHWAKHRDSYGPISSVTVLRQTLVIVSDYKIAVELMEKRSATHSSRPPMVFAGEMSGWKDALASLESTSRLREYRKAIHTTMGTASAMKPYQPLITTNVHQFLLRIQQNPADLRQHIRTQAGAIILQIGYGYTIEPHTRDPLVDLADEGLAQFSRAVVPGAWIVDIIPSLRYLPEILLPSKKLARHWKATITSIANVPYHFVSSQLKSNIPNDSYVARLIKSHSYDEHTVKWTAASLYTGGADTTVSSLACFFLAMTLFPDVQLRARAELDSLFGKIRFPIFSDRPNLPYIEAIVKETLRWHPVAPMGLPHMSTKDDIYNNYRIPKGSLLVPNQWVMLHDPAVYHEPMEFKPERFLTPNPEPDPATIAFGFGRRVCPGKVLADMTLWMSIACTLAVFEVTKKHGQSDVNLESIFAPGIISHPKDFSCEVRPRSEEHKQLVQRVGIEEPLPNHGDAKELDMSL